MTKETLELLQLSENATATDVHNAIVQLLNKMKGKELVLDQLTEERNSEIVQNAFALGKISVGQTNHYKALLKKDFNNTKLLLESIPAPEVKRIVKDVKVTDLIQRGGKHSLNADVSEEGDVAPKDKTKWTLEHYRKFAPKELKANPALFHELLEKEKTNA